MEFTYKNINRSIKRKFINPLNSGCNYNIIKLDNDKLTKHNETISLLKQAHKTLLNVDYNLKNYNLVDANTLLRSSFEYIMMAMMIQFDEDVYEEFIKLGIRHDKTSPCEIISKFRTHMNEISAEVFKDINRDEKLLMLTELYDKLCDFTHSTLIVSTMMEIKKHKEQIVFRQLMYQNYYFLKILLYLCLKYFTHDKDHYLELTSIGFPYMFLMADIGNKIKEYKIDFSKYKDLLYFDKNIEYFNQNKKNTEKVILEIKELKTEIENNSNKFVEELLEFLK